jgi:hypothetical protein
LSGGFSLSSGATKWLNVKLSRKLSFFFLPWCFWKCFTLPYGSAKGDTMKTFLNGKEDVKWLKETHLKEFKGLKIGSFMLHGNEDCPEKLELFPVKMPRYDAKPSAVFVLNTKDENGFSYIKERRRYENH